MKKQLNPWLIGILSAVVAAFSGLWPAAAAAICPGAGSFCGGCTGNCLSLPGVFWISSLYIGQMGGNIKQQPAFRRLGKLFSKIMGNYP